MLILGRDRMKYPERGYARTFLTQLEQCLGIAHDRGCGSSPTPVDSIPPDSANAVRTLPRTGRSVTVAHVEGDDLLDRAEDRDFRRPDRQWHTWGRGASWRLNPVPTSW